MAFDEKELRYLQDRDFLLTKRTVTEKMEKLLWKVRDDFSTRLESVGAILDLPEGIDVANGKVSKGENYRGLPYLVLDYPRLFTRESVAAVRTMFWWGNEFSCVLHLQGEALETTRDRLPQILRNDLCGHLTHFCVNVETPFEYHFGADNYLTVKSLGKKQSEEAIAHREFIKIGYRLPLEDWERLRTISSVAFEHCFLPLFKKSGQ